MASRAVMESLEDKVWETIERAERLVGMAPAERLGWRPPMVDESTAVTDLGHLIGHLLSCMAGLCAALHAAFPEKLSSFQELRKMKVDHFCSPQEAKKQIEAYAAAIEEGLACCNDEDLRRKVQTVFVPEGETLMTILLGNLEHLMNHKYQLFFYLKMMGVEVGTGDLYQLRG
jgi:hypothetical protein